MKEDKIFTDYIRSQLDLVSSWIQNNSSHEEILACYTVITSIQQRVAGIQAFSPKVLESIGDTITIIEWILSDEEASEIDVFPVWPSTDIFLMSSSLIVYSNNWNADIVPLSEIHRWIIGNIIKYWNRGLEVASWKESAFSVVSQDLNDALNTFWLYFWISDSKFFMSDSEFVQEAREEEEEVNSKLEVPEQQVEKLISNTLYFWTNWEKSLALEIYSPLKKGKSTNIEVKIWPNTITISPQNYVFF